MKMEDEKKDAAMKDQRAKSSEEMLDEKAKENFKKDAMKMSDKGLEQKIKNLTTPGSLDYQVYSNPEQIAKVFEEELNRRKTEKKDADNNSDSKFGSEIENQRYKEGKEGLDNVKKELLPNIKKDVEEKLNYYKNYDPYIMIGKKTGLNAAQKKAVELNIAQNKENIAFYTGKLEAINEMLKDDKAENKSVPGSEEALDKAWKFLKSKYINDIVRGPFKSIQIKAGSSDRAKELGKELEADYNYKLYGVYDGRYVYIPTNKDTLFPDESPEETARIKIF